MPITFLDEEEDIAPLATPAKRKITFLDEEEDITPLAPQTKRKITFLDEEEEIAPVTPQAAQPAVTQPSPYKYDPARFRPKGLAAPKAEQEIGTLEGIANAARNAFDSSRQALDIVGDVTPEEAKNIAKIEFDKQSRKVAPGYDEYQKAEGFDAVLAFAKNPIEVTSNIVAEGLAGSLPALGAGLAAGGVGAAAGSVVPVVGTAAGFTAGQVAGTFAGSLATEYGSKILEEMQEGGVDLTKPESIQGFFENEEAVAAARDKAISRGIPVAAFDAISAGIGGKLGRVIGKQFLTKTGEAAAELGVQAGLGGGGEVAGALAAGEPIEGKAVFAEVIGEAGPGAAEIITGRMADRAARVKAEEDAKIKAAAQLSDNLEQNSAPLTAAVVKSTTATTIEQDKLAAQLEEQLDADEIEKQVSGQLAVTKEPTTAPPAIQSKEEFTAIYSQVAPEELDAAEAGFTNTLATAATEEARANAQNALEAIKEVKATVTPPAPTVEPTITPAVTPAVPTAQPPITDATQEIIQPEGVRQEPQDGTQVQPTEETGVGDSLLGAARGQEEGQVVPAAPAIPEAITRAIEERRPISAPFVLQYGVDLPSGWTYEDDFFVPPAEPATAAEVPAVTTAPAAELAAPVEPTISEIPATSELVGAEPTQPTIREVPEISPIVGAEPAAIVEQEPVAPVEPAPTETVKLPIEEPPVKISRGENFSMYGEYNVSIGDKKHRIYRDPERGYWYDADVQEEAVRSGSPEQGSPSLGLLSTETRKDAIAELVNKYKEEQQAAIPLEAPTPVTEAVTPAAEQPAASIPVSGKPFEFFSIRNKEKAPSLGTQFGQDVEPSGKYISQSTPDAAKNLDARFEKKTVRFENPLVVEFGGEYGTPTNWKNVLSSQYGGKTGKELSQAIRDAGYDGIVTVEPAKGPNRPASTSEIVDISSLKPKKQIVAPTPAAPAEPAAEPSGISVGNRIKLGKSPQTYTIEEVLPQSATERELGEQYYSVKNERTGEMQTVEAGDLTPVKAKPTRSELGMADKARIDAAQKSSDSGNALELIRSNYGELSDIINKIIDSNPKIADALTKIAVEKTNRNSFDGQTVRINSSYTGPELVETINHEIAHAFLAVALREIPSFREAINSIRNDAIERAKYSDDASFRAAVKLIREARDLSSTPIYPIRENENLSQYMSRNSDSILKLWRMSGKNATMTYEIYESAYALASNDEFLAHLLSDQRLREELKKYKVFTPDNRNLFQKFIDAVKGLFKKLAKVEKSVLDKAMEQVEYVVQLPEYNPRPIEGLGEIFAKTEPTEEIPKRRKEQVAGMEREESRYITTPEGIIKQTNDVLREKFFDGTTVSPEKTTEAWGYISRLLDIKSGAANEFAGQINDVVDQDTNSEARMGASLFSVSLANYAAKLAAQGDSKMLKYMIRNVNSMPTDKYAGGKSDAGRALRSAKEYDIDGYGAIKIEVKAKVERTAATLFGTGSPTDAQVKAVEGAIKESDAQELGNPEEVAQEVEKVEKRTKRKITDKIEKIIGKGSLKGIIQAIKETPLEKQQEAGWIEKVVNDFLVNAGLSPEVAATASKLYESLIAERLAEARQKAFEDNLNKSAPWKDYLARNSRLAKDALKKLQEAIRTGALDPEQNVESIIAAESGWSGFTKDQYQKIVQLDSIINDPKQDDVTRREAMADLNKVISDAKLPVRFKDALGAYYVGNALMGIPTLTVNIASPIGFTIRNLMTDVGKFAFTDPARIPVAFETFLDSMRSWYDQTSYAFKNQIYMNDVVEYLQGQNVLRELFDKGKKQWAEGKYAEGFVNMAVGMTQITGRVLSSLDQGAISMLENQNITRYAMEALANTKGKVPKDKLKEFANMVIDTRRKTIAQSIANGMSRDRAGVLADLAVKSEVISALSQYDINPMNVLDSSINDALQSVGRNKTLTIKGVEESQQRISDSGFLSYLPIKMLEDVAQSSGREGSAMQIFAKMLYGFALVPARVFHNVAWFSPYGFIRLGVDKYKKNKGEDSPYAMSLQTEAQYRQRLTDSIAGSIAMLGLAALSSASTDEDEDKKFKIVITGNGPSATTDKQYFDSWMKKWKPYSVHIVVNGNIIPINIGRGGEALFFPIMLAGALDDWKIKQKQNLTKKEPEDLSAIAQMLGSSFFALAQRGPYAAFTKPLFDASKDGRVTEELASQAGFFGKTFIPVVGSSLARNISDLFNDPVDRSSIEGAIYANTPVVGPWLGTKALNALGQPIRADDWGDKLYKLGVPVVFSFPKETPMNALNELILKQGSGPTIPTRANAQKRFGDVITDKEFEAYVREYGRVMSDKMFKSRTKLANMKPADYDDELEKYARGYSIDGIKIKGASDSAVLAVKRMRQ